MDNKIKQAYKIQEPKQTSYKRVISTSYSSSISRQKPFNLNQDIHHHLVSPDEKNELKTEKSQNSQFQQKINFVSANKQFNTERETIDVNTQKSAQYDINSTKNNNNLTNTSTKPIFQNAMLNQTQDYTNLKSQSKPNLLPDVSQTTIPMLDLISQKYQVMSSQGQRSKYRTTKETKYGNMISSGQQENLRSTLDGIDGGFSLDMQQQKLNIMNRSFVQTGNNHKRQKIQKLSNDFQSVEYSGSKHLNINLVNSDNNFNSQTASHQNSLVSNQFILLRNQRLKLLDTIKRKSNNLESNVTSTKANTMTQTMGNIRKYTHNFTQVIKQNNSPERETMSALIEQPQFLSHPHTFREPNDAENQENSHNLVEVESIKKQKSAENRYYDINSRQILIQDKRSLRNQEVGTQTGNAEFLQILANQKHGNLKKLIDNIAKDVDQQEIDIEAKSKTNLKDKIIVNKDKHKVYAQSIQKLVELLYDDQGAQQLSQKMNQILKKQFKRYISGIQQAFVGTINFHYDLQQRWQTQFNQFRDSIKNLSEQLKQTHILLLKEREINFDDYLTLDKDNPTRKAFELVSNLNNLLQTTDQNNMTTMSFGGNSTTPGINDNVITIANIQGNGYQETADDLLAQFERIDQMSDAFDRRTRKTQLLLQLQASDVTRTLKEVHQILMLKNQSALNKQLNDSLSDSVRDEEKTLRLMQDIEKEITQRFSTVQKQTALKVLNRYYKPHKFKEIEIQTEDNKIYEKYMLKKEMLKGLRVEKEGLEKNTAEISRQMKILSEEHVKIKNHLRIQEVVYKESEEKMSDMLKREVIQKMRNDDLNKQLQELDLNHQKTLKDREYLLQKIQRKTEKLQKLQLSVDELASQKFENEKKMKVQLDSLQENFQIMSDAYVKERTDKEGGIIGTDVLRIESLGSKNHADRFLSESQFTGSQYHANDTPENRNSNQSKNESTHKFNRPVAQNNNNGNRGNNTSSTQQQKNEMIRKFNGTGASLESSINEDDEFDEHGKKIKKKLGPDGQSHLDPRNLKSKGKKQGDKHGTIDSTTGLHKSRDDSQESKSIGSDMEGNRSQFKSHPRIKSRIRYMEKDGKKKDGTINDPSNGNNNNNTTDHSINPGYNKSVKFNENLKNEHKSMFNHIDKSQEMLLMEQDSSLERQGTTGKNNGMQDKYNSDYKFADYMRPIRNKYSSKAVTQFDDVSGHLLHNERCGPNCSHLLRGNNSPNKNKRQLLPLKKQKLELEDEF